MSKRIPLVLKKLPLPLYIQLWKIFIWGVKNILKDFILKGRKTNGTMKSPNNLASFAISTRF